MPHWNLDTVILLYMLAAAIAFSAAGLNWMRRSETGLWKLAVVFVIIGLWALFSGLEYLLPDVGGKFFFTTLSYTTISVINALSVIFISEYFRISWLGRRWKAWLWGGAVLFTLLEWSNYYHRLIWAVVGLDPNFPARLDIQYGPLFIVDLGYSLLVSSFALALAIIEIRTRRGWQRTRAHYIGISLSIPYIGYFTYLGLENDILGIHLMPICFSITCLLITWVVFKDLQYIYIEQASLLRKNIQNMQDEVENRKQLEHHLLETQEGISVRIAEQTQKLTGLYEMIVLAGQELPRQEVLDQSLERIRATLNSDLVVYYDPAWVNQRSTSARQPGFDKQWLDELQLDWVPADQPVVMCAQGAASSGLPDEVVRSGYLTCAGMSVRAMDERLGILACFWQAVHTFRVDEISLLGALAEELGVVLENAHLRELTSINATLDERKRLSRNLHDSVVQSLQSLVFTTDNARMAASLGPEKLYPILDQLSDSASLALKELRLMLYQLRLVAGAEIYFRDAVQMRLEAVERRANVEAEFVTEPGASWPPAWEHDLYIITMEALNNALKYAQARRVSVRVRGGGGRDFELLISDNGKGFKDTAVPRTGAGFLMMTDLAKSLGGQLEITSAPGDGTTVSLRVTAGLA